MLADQRGARIRNQIQRYLLPDVRLAKHYSEIPDDLHISSHSVGFAAD